MVLLAEGDQRMTKQEILELCSFCEKSEDDEKEIYISSIINILSE